MYIKKMWSLPHLFFLFFHKYVFFYERFHTQLVWVFLKEEIVLWKKFLHVIWYGIKKGNTTWEPIHMLLFLFFLISKETGLHSRFSHVPLTQFKQACLWSFVFENEINFQTFIRKHKVHFSVLLTLKWARWISISFLPRPALKVTEFSPLCT